MLSGEVHFSLLENSEKICLSPERSINVPLFMTGELRGDPKAHGFSALELGMRQAQCKVTQGILLQTCGEAGVRCSIYTFPSPTL